MIGEMFAVDSPLLNLLPAVDSYTDCVCLGSRLAVVRFLTEFCAVRFELVAPSIRDVFLLLFVISKFVAVELCFSLLRLAFAFVLVTAPVWLVFVCLLLLFVVSAYFVVEPQNPLKF